MFLGEKRGDEEAVEQISVGVYMYDTKYHKLLYIFFFFPHNMPAGRSPRNYPGFASKYNSTYHNCETVI